ncbi:MAG: long-chain fatty acid--CoA ligase [Acidobacteriota bacterium]|nr:long-chain fatty acid--CoA ligase [Acidobacteriota bacterium]
MSEQAILRFVEAPTEGDFEALAHQAFTYQYASVAPFRTLCDRRRATPDTVSCWADIPMVPTRAFKSTPLHTAAPKIVFRSSGTTDAATRSEHHHPFPELYHRVVERSFPAFCIPDHDRVPMLSLIPTLARVEDSSLSFMIDHVMATFGTDASRNVVGARGVDLRALRSWLGARQREAEPCLVLATSLSLEQCVEGLERLGLRFRLPPGSAVFETGGLKTRSREIDPEDLRARTEHRLGVGRDRTVIEYGMTELTSQAYGGALLDRAHDVLLCPLWMRSRIVDPETLLEAPDGEIGLIALLDLANIGSAIHVLTEDLGRQVDGGFQLVGRATGAELRGCSLTAQELAQPAE